VDKCLDQLAFGKIKLAAGSPQVYPAPEDVLHRVIFYCLIPGVGQDADATHTKQVGICQQVATASQAIMWEEKLERIRNSMFDEKHQAGIFHKL
jgi:hypothetical protein